MCRDTKRDPGVLCVVEEPADRAAIEAVRKVILKNLDKSYAEGMQYGMIGYFVPHSVFPAGYHCDPRQPLPFAGLASQKNYMSLYLMGAYGPGEEARWIEQQFAKAGKKLDMGKCCIRFKKLEDLPLDVIGEAVRRVPASSLARRWAKRHGSKHLANHLTLCASSVATPWYRKRCTAWTCAMPTIYSPFCWWIQRWALV